MRDEVIESMKLKLQAIETDAKIRLTNQSADHVKSLQIQRNKVVIVEEEKKEFAIENEILKKQMAKYKDEIDNVRDKDGDIVDNYQGLYEKVKADYEEMKIMLGVKQRELEYLNQTNQKLGVELERLKFKNEITDGRDKSNSIMESALINNFLLGLEITRLSFLHH